MTETFYATLGRVRSDRYADAVVKVGVIEEANRFTGNQNDYNGQPGVSLRIKQGRRVFDYPLIGHQHTGRLLDEARVDTELDLAGKVVEILGEGITITSQIGEDYQILSGHIFGIRPRDKT